MEPQEILENLFDSKIVSILKFFMKNDSGEYYLREISRMTRVSPASTFRILNKLVKIGALKLKEIKTAKLYSLNSNKTTDFLKTLLEVDVIDAFVDQASRLDGVEEILLLGEKGKTKANLLLLGVNIDSNALKAISGELRQKYDYTVNTMSLNRDQYEQMSAMGLYPGSKKVLYRKP
ncbi:helix-turn-helix domain-containing protein [Candidatus Woesearchaeota archaeon]|nr:helix-turn-helix domain-containing protein [Candidatus Woesearchaeota archaeon]